MLSTQLSDAVTAIRAGGIIAYPTEAVFGLGCDPSNLGAIENLLALKGRPPEKGLILIAANFAQLEPWLAPLDENIREKIFASWPGPHTWLVPSKATTSYLLRGQHQTLAVRVSAHPLCQQLCEACGHPLVSTSANLSDQLPATSAREVEQQFGAQIDCILDGDLGQSSTPTPIHDALTDTLIRA